MSTWVRYAPEDRELDLSCLARADYDLIRSLHGEIHKGQGILICLSVPSDRAAGEMYVRKQNGMYWAVHFAGEGHGSHEITVESDEHRRQKDYWYRAAQDAGYEASKELRTGKGTVLDVAIRGERQTGVEIQHSYNKTTVIKTRTTKSYKAGWLPVWFLDSDRRPDWFHEVPSVASNPLPGATSPRGAPRPRSVCPSSSLNDAHPTRSISARRDTDARAANGTRNANHGAGSPLMTSPNWSRPSRSYPFATHQGWST